MTLGHFLTQCQQIGNSRCARQGEKGEELRLRVTDGRHPKDNANTTCIISSWRIWIWIKLGKRLELEMLLWESSGSREQIQTSECTRNPGPRVHKEEVRAGGGEGIGSRQRAESESSVPGQGRMSGRDAKASVPEKFPIEAEYRATHRRPECNKHAG